MTSFPVQHNSFLGGLVAPNCENRPDMDQYGKWFYKADNVRFNTIGSFENRYGFTKVAETKNNFRGDPIRLISFSFNNNESFLIEMGNSYLRFYKNGKQIKKEGTDEAYEIESPIKIEENTKIKYAQSGDIIFIVNGKDPIYEIKRKNIEGTEWTIEPFDCDIIPVEEREDNNENKKIILKMVENNLGNKITFSLPIQEYFNFYKGIYLYVNGEENGKTQTIYLKENAEDKKTKEELIEKLNSSDWLPKYNLSASLEGNDLTITQNEGPFTAKSIRFTMKTEGEGLSYSSSSNNFYENGKSGRKYNFVINSDEVPSRLFIRFGQGIGNYATYFFKKGQTIESQKQEIIHELRLENLLYKFEVDKSEKSFSIWLTSEIYFSFDFYIYKVDSYYDKILFFPGNTETILQAESSFNYFKDKEIGDIFCIEHDVPSDLATISVVNGAIPPSVMDSKEIPSNGNWRFISQGNWQGIISLMYSDDNKKTWTTFRTIYSELKNAPINDNSSGRIETKDSIWIKVRVSFSGNNINPENFVASLSSDSFSINSFYRIERIKDENHAIVEELVGGIGTNEEKPSYKIKEVCFSDKKGWPSTVGFYQNRLLFGKDYYIYTSKTNDFWDFYEPIDVADDDPITMSLLSYKVNSVKNLLTVRNFFAFTGGGEFSISSQGALTQSDKYLNPLSYHGSNDCNPILVGNIVLFVDSSSNTVRMMQYSLESDGYEATDATFTIEQLLDGKKIVETEFLKNSKEALFLTDDGNIFVFKIFPEQNIFSWSIWKHARYKITNICVVPNGSEEDLYIAVDTDNGKQIEVFDKNVYADSVETYSFEQEVSEITTTFQKGTKIVVKDSLGKYVAEVGENGLVSLFRPSKSVSVGLSYTTDAVLLRPSVQTRDGNFTTYNIIKAFKVYFSYRDSYGFQIGIDGENMQNVDFQDVNSTLEEQTKLTTQKDNVLIQSGYNSNQRVRFLQEQPYPMKIENILLEVDFNGR